MRTTAILNLKGGVAKTVTCVNTAAILAADYKKRVLVIDADSQANTTDFFECTGALGTLADLLKGNIINEAVCLEKSNYPGISVLPADDRLMDLDLSSVSSERVNVNCIKRLLDGRRDRFDYCFIDCPPAFNAASAAALLAADDVLIPIKLDAFSLRGMANLMRQIRNMQAINPQLKLAGLLPTMTYKSEEMAKALEILKESKLRVFPPIRKTNKMDDMTFAQQPLVVTSPHSAACVDYRRFVAEYLKGGSGNG